MDAATGAALLADMAEPAPSPRTPLCASPALLYHTGDSSLPEDGVAAKIRRALQGGSLLEVIPVVRETLETASGTPLSVAVTGESGNGMSSFINALRGLGHDEAASAPTGVVRTTRTPSCYAYTHLPSVMLWDLPGARPATLSLESYLEEAQLSRFDLLVVVASEQFSLNHVKLAKAVQALGKPFYVVWTKLDRDLGGALSEGRVLQDIGEHIRESLQKEGVRPPPIFLVSNFDPFLHDFPQLRAALQKDLSDIRFRGPLESLSSLCEKVIQDRVTSLKESVAAEDFQNILGLQDADDLEQCLEAYRSLFGVDNESVQQVARGLGPRTVELMAIMSSRDLRMLCRGDWVLRLLTCPAVMAFVRLLGDIPVLGDLVIRCLRCTRHRRLLQAVSQDARALVRSILEQSVLAAEGSCGPEARGGRQVEVWSRHH
ncbi:Immunity-related GTPase family M protein 1 [Tupaia chinensis]|uniref:Immunity-related GTPase family M protein 1 n=1 Tax=Tupaia chinensis TaxID=246437 RepID=L9L0C8_TUPCH|nr:Immunity-related GTPase family M protein 1 [Tupaia chinensis]